MTENNTNAAGQTLDTTFCTICGKSPCNTQRRKHENILNQHLINGASEKSLA